MDTALVSAVRRPGVAPSLQAIHRVPLAKPAAAHNGGELPESVRRLLSTGDGLNPVVVAAFQSSV